MTTVDALLVVSFGGPEGPDDVMPFLRRVTSGRNVPEDRLHAVAEHYLAHGGVSPINEQCRQLVDALRSSPRCAVPVYWGNRNWPPELDDAVAQMSNDGVSHAAALVTSAYSSFSGCRQYLDDIDRARDAAGDGAPTITKLRPYFDHPGFIEPIADNVARSISDARGSTGNRPHLVFSAHSIPTAMASTCEYERQLRAAARLVVDRLDASSFVGVSHAWQSRSGPPAVPWLEPDIGEHLKDLGRAGVTDVVVVPLGFTSDHMEVIHDLDTIAADIADRAGIASTRAATVGTDPRFVDMVFDLVDELAADAAPASLSDLGVWPMPCAAECCPPPRPI